MSDFQREERYVVFKLRDLVETEKDAVLRLANSINAQEIECVIVESDWPNYEHTWQTIERVSDGSYSDPYAEIERLQSRVAELEITHDGQAASVPKQWRDTMEELEERVAELECMVRAFRACVDLQMVPSWGSPCHDQIHALVGESMEDDQ